MNLIDVSQRFVAVGSPPNRTLLEMGSCPDDCGSESVDSPIRMWMAR